jgi:hypothetical protein
VGALVRRYLGQPDYEFRRVSLLSKEAKEHEGVEKATWTAASHP